jgi:hypothetical protein
MVKSCGWPIWRDHAATSVSCSSARSTITPFSNFTPARTRATRWGALTIRQRDFGGQTLSAPIAGMIPNGSGYTLIGQDGQLYPFG